MAKRKRKLTPAEKAEKERRRREYETIFVNGRMKRVRRPPMIEGLTVDEFIRRNADPIFLHQEEMWEYLAPDTDSTERRSMPTHSRESVSFITTETGDDLVIAFVIGIDGSNDVLSLIPQRHPRFELLLRAEERGVLVSHEGFPDDEREVVQRVVARGFHVDIHTSVCCYHVDLSRVDAEEIAEARKVLLRMHRFGGFDLDMR